jgi:Domain of unknown function (DUF5658)
MVRSSQESGLIERRSGKDRRKTGRPSMRFFLRGGRRENIRRQEDMNGLFCVDRYSQTLFGSIVIILFLCVADALLTLILTGQGAVEINPVMAYYLNIGPYAFLAVKYLLTCLAVFILLICQNIFLRAFRIYTRSLFYVIIAAFITVIVWQFYLIYKIKA